MYINNKIIVFRDVSLSRNDSARDAGHFFEFRDCPGQSGTCGHPMRMGSNKKVGWYSLYEQGERRKLIESTVEKDLGVWLSADLKWKEQCSKAANKAMAALGMIKRTFGQWMWIDSGYY